MNVLGVVWSGTASEAREHAASFLRAVSLPVPDRPVEVMGPEHRNHDHYSPGPVLELLVADLDAAIASMPPDVELLGAPQLGADASWVHVRLPDGRMFGLTTGCVACRRRAGCASG